MKTLKTFVLAVIGAWIIFASSYLILSFIQWEFVPGLTWLGMRFGFAISLMAGVGIAVSNR